jgi:type VI secretion system protein ImpA
MQASATDHASLLAPISPDAPCGEWLRHDGIYAQVSEARREDDLSLPQGIWVQPQKRADWALVEQLCSTALAQRSKDLQLAAWLCEAWLRQRGLPGLVDGLQLIDALLMQYWDGLYPRIEQDDIEARLAPLVWLNKHGAIALGTVQLAAGATPSGRLYTLSEWDRVLRNEQQPPPPANSRNAAPAEPLLARQHFSTAVSMTPAQFYTSVRIQLHEAGVALDQLAFTLHTLLGDLAPALPGLERRLDDCFRALQELAGVPWHDELEQDEEEQDMGSVQVMPAVRPADSAGAPRSREEAFRRLDDIADYLLRTEPHSPVPYLVKRAVGWGNMPLAELLQELLDSESDLKQLYRLLGTRAR